MALVIRREMLIWPLRQSILLLAIKEQKARREAYRLVLQYGIFWGIIRTTNLWVVCGNFKEGGFSDSD